MTFDEATYKRLLDAVDLVNRRRRDRREFKEITQSEIVCNALTEYLSKMEKGEKE